MKIKTTMMLLSTLSMDDAAQVDYVSRLTTDEAWDLYSAASKVDTEAYREDHLKVTQLSDETLEALNALLLNAKARGQNHIKAAE